MKAFSFVFASVLALVFQGLFADAHAHSAAAHCPGMTVTDSISSDFANGTNSTSWVNVIDGQRSFTTSAAGCVIVTFSATTNVYPVSPSHEYLHVRTVLDGKSICALPSTGDVLLGTDDSSFAGGSSMTRICEHVPAGPHTLQMQFHSGGGADVGMYGHTLTVTHN